MSTSNVSSSSLTHASHHPALEKINLKALDFDFDRVCSVTLVAQSVYACLVCGKFFRGQSDGTPLFAHALEKSHWICISLSSLKVYVLPEGQEIDSDQPILNDIRANLRPTLASEEIATRVWGPPSLDGKAYKIDLSGHRYYPGMIGLNPLSPQSDYINAVLQMLWRVRPLVTYFLHRANWEASVSPLVKTFGELTCRVFWDKRFKSTSSPHEFAQAVVALSQGRFTLKDRADAAHLVAWLLTELGRALKSKLIAECFSGVVRVETRTYELVRDAETGEPRRKIVKLEREDLQGEGKSKTEEQGEEGLRRIGSAKVEAVSFNFLSLDLPTQGVFADALDPGSALVPKATLEELLRKYDGTTFAERSVGDGRVERKRFTLVSLPPYLVLHLKRFVPVVGSTERVLEKRVAEVHLPIERLVVPFSSRSTTAVPNEYALLANVVHENIQDSSKSFLRQPIAGGTYVANVAYPKASTTETPDPWFRVRDLEVQKTMKELVQVSETYLALYERKSAA